jgi:ABC-type sugar transport system substrate-binding protein
MKEKTIGVFLLARKNEYQRLQETSAVAMAYHLKTPIEIDFADGDQHHQAKQIRTFISTHPAGSVLVVESVVDKALEPVAREAARAGKGWFLLHRLVGYMDDLRHEFPKLPIGIVTSDQKEIGRIQGRQFEALLPRAGNVLYVQGPEGSTIAADRLAGMREIVDSTSIKYELVRGDWSEESGERAVMKWLSENRTPGQVQLVGCQNDAMAAGALRALAYGAASSGRGDLAKVLVTGVDGTPDVGISMVDQRRIAATIIMPAAAGEAVSLIHQAWTVPGFTPPPIVRLPVRSYPELALVAQRAAP